MNKRRGSLTRVSMFTMIMSLLKKGDLLRKKLSRKKITRTVYLGLCLPCLLIRSFMKCGKRNKYNLGISLVKSKIELKETWKRCASNFLVLMANAESCELLHLY